MPGTLPLILFRRGRIVQHDRFGVALLPVGELLDALDQYDRAMVQTDPNAVLIGTCRAMHGTGLS